MSEYSESYHLRSSSPQEAVDLLKRAKVHGYVLAPGNGWVTFCPKEVEFQPIPEITFANKGLLLHYAYTDDHGWTFSIMEGPKILCTYKCDWEDVYSADATQFVPEYFRDFVEKVTDGKGDPDKVLAHIHSTQEPVDGDDEPVADETAKDLAELLQLPHYDWLSGDYLASDIDGEKDVSKATEQCGYPIVAIV